MAIVQWMSPQPLWSDLTAAPVKTAYRRPALLRFATDTFMEDVQNVLDKTPANVRDYVAEVEDWRTPGAGLLMGSDAAGLKLYQPTHQRFYLVSASLVCRLPGLPDHTVRVARSERISFVLRRLKDGGEFAWIDGKPGKWVGASPSVLVNGEERLPMFSLNYDGGDRTRRICMGLIPVSRRQAYSTATEQASPDPPPPVDPRKAELGRQVTGPWVSLWKWFIDPATNTADPTQKTLAAAQNSAFLLIDVATFLVDYIRNVSDAIQGKLALVELSAAERALYTALDARDSNLGMKLRDAIVKAKDFEQQLETFAQPENASPTFPPGYPLRSGSAFFNAADANFAALFTESQLPGEAVPQTPLRRLFEAALPDEQITIPARAPQFNPADSKAGDRFAVYCVYERPRCGRQSPPVLSARSREFAMAGFFDPDAPARPLQVALPFDTTPAALRKYDKNVAFTISDELQKQMDRIKSAKKLMDGEVGGSQLGITFICSLSIPIITLCAFIVLMIFIQLLNIIFWWLPFFKICFPVPTVKAKS